MGAQAVAILAQANEHSAALARHWTGYDVAFSQSCCGTPWAYGPTGRRLVAEHCIPDGSIHLVFGTSPWWVRLELRRAWKSHQEPGSREVLRPIPWHGSRLVVFDGF